MWRLRTGGLGRERCAAAVDVDENALNHNAGRREIDEVAAAGEADAQRGVDDDRHSCLDVDGHAGVDGVRHADFVVLAHTDIERVAAAYLFREVGSDIDVGVGAYLLCEVSADGLVHGTYLHGLFTSDSFRRAYLAQLGVKPSGEQYRARIESALDALADHIEQHLDVDGLLALAR